MAKECCDNGSNNNQLLTPRYRRILWIALIINFAMFLVEVLSGFSAHSVSLMADAIDFFGDAMNYGISLVVLSMGLIWRARVALLKGLMMGAFGLFVLASAVWSFMHGKVPEPYTMGAIGMLALVANVSVASMLYAYREGDANMQSVWLCSRNDAIGNLAVMLAALGVWESKSVWPDLIVAFIMATLSITGAIQVIHKSLRELK
ncbi:MAG TPA: cation transporter [Methylotenera sp.]